MKAWLWLPLACLVGYLFGSWGAQDELRSFKKHSNDVKAKVAAKPAGFDTFASMVKIPEMARRPRRARRNRGEGAASPISPAAKSVAQAKEPHDGKIPAAPSEDLIAATNAPHRSLSPDDLRARIEEAQDLWRTRVDVARAQWKAKLKLGAEGEKAFDAALQEMNERLYDSVSALAGILADKPEMSPELGLRLVGETTTILAETYDRVGACASADMREEVSKMRMVDFIDPGVAEPLVDVQGKLEKLSLGGGGAR